MERSKINMKSTKSDNMDKFYKKKLLYITQEESHFVGKCIKLHFENGIATIYLDDCMNLWISGTVE